MIPEAETLFSGQYAFLHPAFELVYGYFESMGCVPYVKTQYVGFSLDNQPVASAHPNGGAEIELALALPEDHPGAQLYDASHLKWRTLPVAVRITSLGDATAAKSLMAEAVDRVRQGVHDVQLHNARFATGQVVRHPT